VPKYEDQNFVGHFICECLCVGEYRRYGGYSTVPWQRRRRRKERLGKCGLSGLRKFYGMIANSSLVDQVSQSLLYARVKYPHKTYIPEDRGGSKFWIADCLCTLNPH